MARTNPVLKAYNRKMTADSTTPEAALKSLVVKRNSDIQTYSKGVSPPKAKVAGTGIIDTIKKWMTPKPKTPAPTRAPASPFPALTNAQRDSLSKKYLGK